MMNEKMLLRFIAGEDTAKTFDEFGRSLDHDEGRVSTRQYYERLMMLYFEIVFSQ